MANEITQTVKLSIVNGTLKNTADPGATRITQTAMGMHAPVVSVGTSEEDLDIGDVGAATQGLMQLTNLDTTNYVQWGPKSAGSMVAVGRLKPGESAQLRLEPSVIIRWVANTASCLVQVTLYKA